MLVKAEQAVITAHTTDNRLYIVLNGTLEVQSHENTGGSAASNVQFLAGECVGELSVLDDEDQPHTIIAVGDSELLVIEADTLWQLIDESNGVARNLLRLLSFRIRTTNALLRRRHKVGEFYRQMSMIDGLTGIHNRAWLHSQLPQLIERSHASCNPLSIIMADLDHFKLFNDTHGHIIGDDAIQSAAKILNSTLRPTDFAVRFGGEELLVILPDTAKEACFSVAERLCSKLAQTTVLNDVHLPLPHITASFGVATLAAGQDIFTFIAAADTALYRAKNAGRNQVSH
ncbi:GGDEF domain-containing protein [Solimicrobium silvestre]|nr:GGDEF domain-containing protein [Solimicrobium silvestre]